MLRLNSVFSLVAPGVKYAINRWTTVSLVKQLINYLGRLVEHQVTGRTQVF